MNILGVIPARYGSTRFPGKPLADIQGKPMIQWVYERSKKAEVLDTLVVATDDDRIEKAVTSFGGEVLLTSPDHQSGTERCEEAATRIDSSYDIVINIQGDEPLVEPEQIQQLANLFNRSEAQIGTLVKPLTQQRELFDATVMKVVLTQDQRALYFSRNVIPHVRNEDSEKWLERHSFYKHVGIYGYRSSVLHEIVTLSPTPLEEAEGLEQLRWLEWGYPIHVAETTHDCLSIDTPKDLERLNHQLS